MKKERLQGFAAGLMSAVLVLGLGGAALAATRTVEVDDSIQVTINGVRFSPKDAQGNPVEIFSHNGTTYAPLRAVCEAAGLTVDFDANSLIAALTTAEAALAADPAAANYITAAKAKELALAHAGVTAANAVMLKCRLDWDDGKAEYEVEFYSGSTGYDYDLDALTGAVLSSDRELDDYVLSPDSKPGQSDLISADQAKAIALAKVPGATVIKCELDEDDGRLVYELELRLGTTEYDCELNALTGAILDWDVDHD